MSPGASLDAAISGLTTRVESARRTASELAGVSEKDLQQSESSEAASSGATEEGKGSIIDVTA
jgi:hypothetical protein